MEEIFEFENQEYTLLEVEEAAKKKSLSIDDYIKKYNISRKPGKTNLTSTGADVKDPAAPDTPMTIGALNLDSNLENTLLESADEESQKKFLSSVETFHKEDLNKYLSSLLKKYNAGYLTEENKINPGLNAVDSVVYKERINNINNEYNNFYNSIAQKEYKALLDKKIEQNKKIDPTTGLSIKQNFALGVAKTFESLIDIDAENIGFSFDKGFTGISKGPLLNAKDAFTAAKKLDAYSSALENIEERKQAIINKSKEEGYSDLVTQKQLNFFTDPSNTSGKKIANNEKEYIDYLKINKLKSGLEMFSKLVKADNQFQELGKLYGQGVEILDENGNINLSFGKTSRITGEQFTQFLFSAITAPVAPGRATYIQEIGPMLIEALDAAAIKEFGEEKIAQMDQQTKQKKYITLIEEGKLDLNKLETSAVFSGLLDTVGVVFQGTKIAKAGKPLIRNIFKRKLKETLKIAKAKGADITQATGVEVLTETAQEGLNVMGVSGAAGIKENWALKRFGEVGLQTLITTPILVGGGRSIKSTTIQIKRAIQGAYDPNSLRAEINNQKKVINMLEKTGKITSEQASNEIDNLNATEDIISNSIYSKFEPEAKAEMIDIIAKEEGIKRKIDKLKNTYDADSVFSVGQIKALEEQLKEIENQKQEVIPTQNYLVSEKILLKHINNNPEKYNNYKVFSFETNEELVDFAKRNNISDKVINNILGTEQGFAFGAEIPNQKIFILSKENVKKAKGINKVVGSNVIHHELGHVIMSSLSDSTINNFIKNIRVEAEKLPKGSKLKEAFELARERVKADYSDQSNRIKSEEILTSMSDFLRAIDGNILIDDASFLSKTFSFLAEKLNLATDEQIDFSGLSEPNQALQFLQKYNKSLGNSKNLFQRIKKIATAIPGINITKEIEEDVEKFSKSMASEKVQEIYEAQGAANAMDIIDEFKPITNKIVNRYKDVPGFEFELLRDEIETGKRGILDMIMDYTPEKAKGAPLAAYINSLLPKRAIEAANRILDTEFKLDVTEAKGVTDTATEENIEAADEVNIADEIKSLRKEIGLPEELIIKVKDAVIKTFGTKLPNPQDPKFRLELQKRFRTELKKPMAKFVGKQEAYESFLRDNFKSIYDKMPLSLILKRFKDFAEPVLDKDGKQLRERTAEGNKIFVKKKITPAEFIKYFLGSDVGRSTQGTRKTAIVEAVAEEIAFDATMEVLNNEDVKSKYEQITEITGDILPDNYLAQIAKQIDRNENFKFSQSILSDSGLSSQELSSILFKGFISAAGKLDPKMIEVLLDDAWAKSFPKVLEKYILPGYAEAIKNKSVEEQSDISKYLINIISRPLRTISRQTEELNYNTNYRLFKKLQEIAGDKVFGPNAPIRLDEKIIQYKEGPNKGKFKEKRTYIRDVNGVALGSSTYNTSVQSFHKDLINGKLSREEVNSVFSQNRDRLKELIFGLGAENKGLAISLIKLTQKDQRGLLRSSGTIGGIVQNYSGETVFEHRPPVQYLFEKIVDYIENPTEAKKEQLNKLLNTAEINVVPKDFAEIVDQNYKTTIPKNGKISYEKALNQTNYTFDGMFRYSKSLSKEFNNLLQQTTGVPFYEKFSPVKATMMGRGKGKKFFIPYSADDFVGLLYATLGTKKQGGNEQMKWYEENLLRPFSRGIQQYETAKQVALRNWQALKKEAKKDVPGGLNKVNETGFTNQNSLRIYMWRKQGIKDKDIPGISSQELRDNSRIVRNNPKLKAFAERLMALNPEGYPPPSTEWIAGDITTDLVSYINDVKRAEYLTQWKENVDQIFNDQNKNKLKALYGESYIKALENMLYRMEKGRNKFKDASDIERKFQSWVNNSVGSIMFFNARSAVLQTLSAVNFINFSDNNPIAAGIALANFPQYVKDFSTLFNSDFLKQRRSGLQTDVNADEIAKAAATSKNQVQAMLAAILKFGFTPTQIADSFAIASGGATFYRNRINKYKKEGLSQKEAEQKAFTDFQEIAEETQQSARPDRISMQQAGSLGRLVLAFGNTPMQYARLTKKAMLDLINGRGDWKTNISKIAYYSVIQNIIFSALQQGLFALLFDDEEEDDKKARYYRIGNSSADTLLRGMGVYGAAAATVKNMIIKIVEEAKKSRPDYTKVAIEATAISPPINSKLRKLVSAGKTFTYKQSKEKVFTEGFSLDNPAFLAAGKVISAATNLPADRVVLKMDHIYTAMQPETELWQGTALTLGWSEWELGMIEKQTKKESNLKIKPFKKKSLKIKKFKN